MSTPTSKSHITIARKLDQIHGNLVEEFVKRIRNNETSATVFVELNDKYLEACTIAQVAQIHRERFARSITALLLTTEELARIQKWETRAKIAGIFFVWLIASSVVVLIITAIYFMAIAG